jgi:spore coat protein A
MKRLLFLLILAAPAIGFAPQEPLDGLAKFVDPLPELTHIRPPWPGPFRLTLHLRPFTAKLHRDLPPTAQWGYDGMSPGPVIEVESGQWLRVEWKNELPTVHLFPLPTGADAISPDVRSVTHLHGAVVTEPDPMDRVHNNDGWPDAWNVPGQSQIADYPNRQTARMLWYHDHAMGSTGRNVAAGLLGLYEIHDAYERSLNLPSGRYEIPLAIQSHGVNPDGTLYYSPDIGTEYYGNAVAVNGKLWPYLEVEPRKYRLRMINVSNARTYAMKLFDAATNAPGPAFYQIGTDSGFLADTATLNDPAKPTSPRLTLAPAERADVIVDFSGYAGRSFILQNNNRDIGDNELALPQIMLFKVGSQVTEPDHSQLPMHLRPIPRIPVSAAKRTRQIVFDQMLMPGNLAMQTLNGKRWSDPIEELPELGSTEVWELYDTLIDVHPFHIHLVEFQVLNRQLFDVAAYLSTHQIHFTGPEVPPAANELGWKDTVRVMPQMVTRIIMRFLPHPGYYVYHCHILEHEDMDMMRPFRIVLPGDDAEAPVTER